MNNTHGVDVPDSWKVEETSRLNNDGLSFVLTNEEERLEIWIEGLLREEYEDGYEGDTLGFWGLLRKDLGKNEGWEEVDGPNYWGPGGYGGTTDEAREAALEWLEETINEHQ